MFLLETGEANSLLLQVDVGILPLRMVGVSLLVIVNKSKTNGNVFQLYF